MHILYSCSTSNCTNLTSGFLPCTQKKRVMSLDIGLLISGAKERGELEARVTELIKEVKKSGEHRMKLKFGQIIWS